MRGPTVCETQWGAIISSFERNQDELIAGHPECTEELALLRTGLHTIGQLTDISPPIYGNGAVWKELIARAEAKRAVLCKHLDGKEFFIAMLCLYAAIHTKMCNSVLPAQQLTEEFCEQRRHKQNPQKNKPINLNNHGDNWIDGS
jgi:hypothetical protein